MLIINAMAAEHIKNHVPNPTVSKKYTGAQEDMYATTKADTICTSGKLLPANSCHTHHQPMSRNVRWQTRASALSFPRDFISRLPAK